MKATSQKFAQFFQNDPSSPFKEFRGINADAIARKIPQLLKDAIEESNIESIYDITDEDAESFDEFSYIKYALLISLEVAEFEKSKVRRQRRQTRT
jgi:hypothetical protein